MISAKFLQGNVLLGGKQQIDAKNSNFESFESALCMKSVNMPLTCKICKIGCDTFNQFIISRLYEYCSADYCTPVLK